METNLLQTKLYTPSPHPNLVPRPRLLARLKAKRPFRLILLSASAGYGKTTLVTEWIAQLKTAVCWYALDQDDNDPQQFFSYLAAAVQSLPAVQNALTQQLQSPQPLPAKSLMTAFINDVAPVSTPFHLVLDDYHSLDNSDIDTAIAFLLDNMPPQMTLVITSREDPPLPLPRYRVRGQMIELRVADLRFTPAETAVFLNQMMGLTLSPTDIAALETRTEGWIAGLQLAALSLQGRTDPTQFITAFTGSNRFVLDYLLEEVLQSQTKPVRHFLLQTAVLDRLTSSLCDAVTGQPDSHKMLTTLERGNLFLVPLDDERRWYRYHHLFAEVLQAHMRDEQPHDLPTLHQRASHWYEQNGFRVDAIRHALAAADFEWAARLIELSWRAMDRRLQLPTWLGWARALPQHILHNRPVLTVGYAWALFDASELEAAQQQLDTAEQQLQAPPKTMIVADETEFGMLSATIAAARAYYAQALGDVAATIYYAQEALDLLPKTDHLNHAIPSALLGLAYWTSGNLDAAYQALAAAMNSFQLAGNRLLAISATFGMADIRLTQGRLQEAVATYEKALQIATAVAGPPLRGTADLYLGLSELYREQGKEAEAAQLRQKSETLNQPSEDKVYNYHWALVQARLLAHQGEFEAALVLLDKAEVIFAQIHIPDVRPVAALKARLWIRQGNLTAVSQWVQAQALSSDDNLSYLREFEHITLARFLIAQPKTVEQGLNLLTRLLEAAQAGARGGTVIELLLLQALGYQAQGNHHAAQTTCNRALILAESENFAQPFLDEGTPLISLLRDALAQGIAPSYTHKLLALFGTEPKPNKPSPASTQPLVEPLSPREQEILALIATGLKNKEIAEQLIISLNTVLYHTKNIYSKLGVNKRALAIAKAQTLDLI